jgi:hypothetical protein
MAKEKSIVEEAILQMKNLEEAVAENAKGILASTMKEEIKELVKESLNEQDDEEIDVDSELELPMGDEDEDDNELEDMIDMDDEEEEDEDFDVDMDFDMDSDEEDDTIDLTMASDEEILKVFKAMSDEDGIIVKKDGDMLHLTDENEDDEYIIQLGESEEDEEVEELDEMEDEVIYELEMDFDEEDDDDLSDILDYEHRAMSKSLEDDDFEELDFNDEDLDFSDEEDEDEFMMESEKSNFKPKGVGIGNASKFKYEKKPNQDKGFDVKKKQGTRGVGMGKPKFEYKEDKDLGKNQEVKKVETKEASRTLASGKRFGKKGLDKPKAAPRHLRVESTNEELNLLREKNEEYRKALNVFRTKLNEVAVFNSNLAYATRLFTEHSTTKQEKINILRRFDGVETIKESKNLYHTIKDELSPSNTGENNLTESFERTVIKTPTSGSAVNLIESKTYENPQFLRMKDLMSKLK